MITPAKLRKLIETDNKELISHALCDAADRIFYDHGAEAVPPALRTVLAVETFYGEVANGGLIQYLSNGHEAFAVYAPTALEEVGLPIPAKVLRRAVELFPREIRESPNPDYVDYFDTIDRKFGPDYLENEIEQEFWNWYHDGHEDEIRNQLHVWIVANEVQFATER